MEDKIRTRQRNLLVGQVQEYLRQSVPIESLQPSRNSFANGCQPSPFRSSDVTSLVSRFTQNKFSLLPRQYSPLKETSLKSPNSLLTTLHELEIKVLSAKKQLQSIQNNSKNRSRLKLQDLPISSSKKQEDEYLMAETQESTTVNIQNQKVKVMMKNKQKLVGVAKIKTYYISEIAKGTAGTNEKAYKHLKMSLDVLRANYSNKLHKAKFIKRANLSLPCSSKNSGKKTLVLDMDETLIHCSLERKSSDDIEITIDIEEPMDKAYVSIRPYAISFLKRARKHFEIIAFTASDRSYADVILDQIDPEKTLIDHRLYREHCVKLAQKVYTKDLKIINREMSQIILVDNSPVSYLYQLDNGVPILPYQGGEDMQLLNLQKYLEQVNKQRDVRRLNRATFKLWRYRQFQECETLVQSLYYQANSYY